MGKKVTTATAGGGLFRLMFVKRRRDKPERGTVRGPQLDSRPREDNADETVLIIAGVSSHRFVYFVFLKKTETARQTGDERADTEQRGKGHYSMTFWGRDGWGQPYGESVIGGREMKDTGGNGLEDKRHLHFCIL